MKVQQNFHRHYLHLEIIIIKEYILLVMNNREIKVFLIYLNNNQYVFHNKQ